MRILSESIGIDPGTASVKIYIKGKGIVLDEPCLAAVDKNTGEVVSVGTDAEELISKIPDSVSAVNPVKHGEIYDYNTAERMFRMFFDKCSSRRIVKPRVLVAVSSDCTDVQKRAIEEALVSAGVKSVVFKNKSLAAAVGAGIDINDISGNLIIDIGCGSVNAAVISMGAVVASKSAKIAGDDFAESIIRHIKNKYGVGIGHRAAEEVKTMLAGDDVTKTDGCIVVGRDVLTGLPRSVKVLLCEIKEALSPNLMDIVDQIRSVIELTPSELVSDIMDNGAVLTGGSSFLPGLSEIIYKELNIRATMADNPRNSVVIGLGRILDKEYIF